MEHVEYHREDCSNGLLYIWALLLCFIILMLLAIQFFLLQIAINIINLVNSPISD